MKIGILTLPLSDNYGGLLQNYALQEVVRRQGFDVWTINRDYAPIPIAKKAKYCLIRFILKYFLCEKSIVRIWDSPTDKEKNIISQHTNQFIKENIRITEKFRQQRGFSLIKKQGYTAYIVGSDQVWRPKYSPCITNYFLDFVAGNNNVKKIAYAASFGVNDWEFSAQQAKSCTALVKQFNAISVRENSAIKLCEKHLGVDAIQVLDPTMLLKKEDYLTLIEQNKIQERASVLFTYILDESADKKKIIQQVANDLNLTPLSIMPTHSFDKKTSTKDLSDCIFAPVAEWLAGFRDAKFVVTDSFHGCVFCIIFNKPFIAYVNKSRGATRFESLLNMFQLQDRCICDSGQLNNELMTRPIDWTYVNNKWATMREVSVDFLQNNL